MVLDVPPRSHSISAEQDVMQRTSKQFTNRGASLTYIDRGQCEARPGVADPRIRRFPSTTAREAVSMVVIYNRARRLSE